MNQQRSLHSFGRPVMAWLIAGGMALAGNTGTMTGRVFEKTTGEPLAGASVVVENTELGASADPSGHYIVINIPPGKYTVTASCMGYTHQSFTGVLIVQDNTVSVDFRLPDTVYDLGIRVDVVGEQWKLKPDRPAEGRGRLHHHRRPVHQAAGLRAEGPGRTQPGRDPDPRRQLDPHPGRAVR